MYITSADAGIGYTYDHVVGVFYDWNRAVFEAGVFWAVEET